MSRQGKLDVQRSDGFLALRSSIGGGVSANPLAMTVK
jgi:hypothetical protein